MRWTWLLTLLISQCLVGQQTILPGQLGAGAITKDAEAGLRSNQLLFGINSSTTYDDGALSQDGTIQPAVITSLHPNLGLIFDRSRLRGAFHYSPGITYSPNAYTGNSFSQVFGGEMQYAFSKRLSFSIQESYTFTTDPFSSIRANNEQDTTGVLQKPNTPAVGTDLRSSIEQFGSEVAYRISAHTSIGGGAGFGRSNYKAQNSAAEIDSDSWSASTFVSHQLSAKYSLGLQYSSQHYRNREVSQISTTGNEVLAFLNVSLNRFIQLSVFGGPNFVQTSASSVSGISNSQTRFTAGAAFAWQGEHSGMAANFVQRVSNTGTSGSGAANVRSGGITVQRRLNSRWSANGFANYTSEAQLASLGSAETFYSVIGGAGVSRMLVPRLSLSIDAFHQQFIGTLPQIYASQHSHKGVTVSLSYNIARPIGR